MLDNFIGVLATNVIRAMISYQAIVDNPNVSQSTTYESGVEVDKEGAKVGTKSGKSFETTSTDIVLRNLQETNQNIQLNLITALEKHTIKIKKSRDGVPVLTNYVDILFEAPSQGWLTDFVAWLLDIKYKPINLASKVGWRAVELANEAAHDDYLKLREDKESGLIQKIRVVPEPFRKKIF